MIDQVKIVHVAAREENADRTPSSRRIAADALNFLQPGAANSLTRRAWFTTKSNDMIRKEALTILSSHSVCRGHRRLAIDLEPLTFNQRTKFRENVRRAMAALEVQLGGEIGWVATQTATEMRIVLADGIVKRMAHFRSVHALRIGAKERTIFMEALNSEFVTPVMQSMAA